MSARTTRAARTRLLAAAALTVATLSLTACNSSEGVRDEGASSGSSSSSTGKGHAEAASSKNEESAAGNENASGATGKAPAAKSPAGKASGGNSSAGKPSTEDSSARLTPCTDIRTTATVVNRPLNHLLLTVTNTGSKNCDLVNYPAVRLGEAQSVPPVFEESKPQAVVTLAPGESGYAGVLLSAADGSGSNGYTAKTLTVYLDTKSQKSATPSLPKKGVYVDHSLKVTYWQFSMADALAW
ncbi:DUF4232 domain-containing protein [Streptomyces sp. MMBL 11-3]|uniref:DUF4232 domain-containing protein n=1 Tax=Streptomyces sp. MMBL 11-3 TaxID=3382639 RepID=UPI0039B5172F